MFNLALPLAIAGEFPVYFVAVYAVGLVAAVSLGLIAWYNSKRPVGWENSQRPDFIPELKLGNEETTAPDLFDPNQEPEAAPNPPADNS
ncbi:hypothetical protein [Synechocystis sp. LKSZ1]|uniref:photosystem II assembly protein Psb35 n=1 Tax=Synechocystis sp. LKSZ1 TaxID=3144951 RepID=UPI00336C24E2